VLLGLTARSFLTAPEREKSDGKHRYKRRSHSSDSERSDHEQRKKKKKKTKSKRHGESDDERTGDAAPDDGPRKETEEEYDARLEKEEKARLEVQRKKELERLKARHEAEAAKSSDGIRYKGQLPFFACLTQSFP
jgi:peptidyl-prolyl isomerase G (cyclophilin G)